MPRSPWLALVFLCLVLCAAAAWTGLAATPTALPAEGSPQGEAAASSPTTAPGARFGGIPLPATAQACSAKRPQPVVPTDPELCASLADAVRDPSALPLAEYQETLNRFLRAYCHRDEDRGWKRDKQLRPTGPYIATLADGRWDARAYGTHAPVVIWYSPEMIDWLEAARPEEGGEVMGDEPVLPDGAIMVKEMYPAPAAACAGVDPTYLVPDVDGAAIMVRDAGASHDGWYWGWFGWTGWSPDYPASNDTNRYPYQGFGQYCANCHASAKDHLTFAALENVEGYPGDPLVYLGQHFFADQPETSHHRLVTLPEDDAQRLGQPHFGYDAEFVQYLPAGGLPRPTWDDVPMMPSQTYDNTWVAAGGPTVADQFVTSSQCIGCHDAGATGLQFDMTEPNPEGDNLLNLSPYATWRTSPMGLGGRDPIFFAQLASEVDTFHPGEETARVIQDVCLGCHGINGQRQHAIDHFEETGDCGRFPREAVNAVPYPADPAENPLVAWANYGALARDGISCTSCHHMLVGEGGGPALGEPQNHCVEERQEYLNPESTGFARTFTGSFLVGPPDELYGPFADPQTDPMENALGIRPVENLAIQASELCGTCHTVHLPVMQRGTIIGYTYEQTTYPEWAFSAYRTGTTPQGELPEGAGARAESCQSCHMASKDADGTPFRSKIAGIQERSNFPETANTLPASKIDLAVREGFARHTLVGLNVFLVKMAQQFPDVLGIRTQDPMLTTKGLDPLLLTEQKMLDQASNDTVDLSVRKVSLTDHSLEATVRLDSHVGHKFPSGVGFRRAFLTFEVLDDRGDVLWASGRVNGAGLLVDGEGEVLPGELWWTDDCSAHRNPDRLVYQQHHQRITRQDQVQIYQELVAAPPADVESPECGPQATPTPPFTTSFLSICGHVKDNRILPAGFLDLPQRTAIAKALGAQQDLAIDSGPHAVDGDPDYVAGGGDTLVYAIPRSDLAGNPTSLRVTLSYQATPPYYLQDRFCTSKSEDTQRLYFLAGHLNLNGTAAESWALEVVSTEQAIGATETTTETGP